MVIVVLAGLTQLICVWLAAGGSGCSACFFVYLSICPCKSLCMSGHHLAVGLSRIVQIGMVSDNSVLLHVCHPLAV